jgi:hypothetical protein
MDTMPVGTISARRQSLNFGRHFFAMCAAMCLGGGALYALLFVAGPALGAYADPTLRAPELSLLAVAVVFTLPMVLWMRFRRMDWAPILEMSAAALAVAVLFIGLAWLGVLSQSTIRELAGPAFCGPACVAMVGVMLFRLDLYTGRTGHHAVRPAGAGG